MKTVFNKKDSRRILKRYLGLCAFFFVLVHNVFSQKEANIWHFGDGAGLDFSSFPPVAIAGSAMDTPEGCASISDSIGNLLFYTDGITVWNSSHNEMPNGNGLLGNGSSTQATIIVRKPETGNIYYIFTTDANENNGADGLNFSEVDMGLDGGLGDVTATKNITLLDSITEKLSFTLHADGESIWVLTQGVNSNTFYAYLVTSTGVSTTPVTSNVGIGGAAGGCLKISPDGSRLATSSSLSDGELFDFNNATGEVSNPVVISSLPYYGAEFSPSGELLYIAINESIIQYDLTVADIANSADTLVSSINIVPRILPFFGALQLAPDGKIYIALVNGGSVGFLSIINNPNERGSASNYVEEGIQLAPGTGSRLGLPQFRIKTSVGFSYIDTCSNSATTFTNNTVVFDSLLWNFGDPSSGSSNTSTATNPIHVYENAGLYTVTLIAYNGNQADTASQLITILQIDDASFSYSSELYCISEIDPIPTVSGLSGGIFSSDSLVLDTNTGQIDIVGSGIGNYEVTYNTNGRCSNTSTVTVQIDSCLETTLIVPNVFSPNGDGKNDQFRVSITGSNIKEIQVQIYNRWGQLLFETNQINAGWDGFTSGGLKASEGTYFYTITTVTSDDKKETLQGTFTLLR